MSKLLSKCVEQQLWEQVESESVHISNSQAGFRPCRSRYDLITLLRCAQEHYHPKGRVATDPATRRIFAAFLDITKAYDSVPHVGIVERLRAAGVSDHLFFHDSQHRNRTTVIYRCPISTGRGPVGPCLCWKVGVPQGPAIIAKKPHHAQEPSSHLLPSTTTSSSLSWLFYVMPYRCPF